MATVTIGNHSKIVARRADQARIRAFYKDVLGCELTKETPDADFIHFDGNFFLAVLYQDQAVGAEDARAAIWLELRAEEPAALNARIIDFGVHRIEMPGAEHLYFQAPGGQVFRVVGRGDDLTRFEHDARSSPTMSNEPIMETDKTHTKPVTATIRAAQTAKAITDGEIVLATIDVPATPERVVRALMTDECERWWGAAGVYTIESWKATLRPRGTWSMVIRLPDGTALPSSGEFLEVTPTKIVQTRRYDFDHPTLGRRVTKVTTLLAPLEQGTRIIVRHDDFGGSEPAIEHAGGWERMLDWLGEHLRSEAKASSAAKGGVK